VFSPGSGTWLLTNYTTVHALYAWGIPLATCTLPIGVFYLLIRYLLTRNAAGTRDPTARGSQRIGSMTPAGTVSALPCPVSRPDGRARGVEDAVEAVPRRGLPYGF
jgi:hypothetical protein